MSKRGCRVRKSVRMYILVVYVYLRDQEILRKDVEEIYNNVTRMLLVRHCFNKEVQRTVGTVVVVAIMVVTVKEVAVTVKVVVAVEVVAVVVVEVVAKQKDVF